MYCPKCEFEFKQDIAECPICGGTLTAHPEESAAGQVESFAPGDEDVDSEQPSETVISELLLDAKQEFDSLESEPTADTQQDDPLANPLDRAALFSEDSAEPAVPDTLPDTSAETEEIFLLDDDHSGNTPEAAILEQEAPVEREPASKEIFFSDDNLFSDETGMAPDTADTPQTDDDPNRNKLESSLDSLIIPTREGTAPIEQTEDIPFNPETFQEQSDTATASDDSIKDLENSLDSVVVPSRKDSPRLPWQVEEDTTPTSDDSIKELENSLDSVVVPSQEDSPGLPWQVEEDISPIEQNEDMPFNPEALQEQSDTATANDDNIKELENSLDSVVVPSWEGSSDLPWQPEQDPSPIEQTGDMPFTPEALQEQPDALHMADLDSVDTDTLDITESTEEQPPHGKGRRSKKRLILTLLLGVLIIAAAYLLGNYFLLNPASNQTKKTMPARIPPRTAAKKAPASIPALETQAQKPSTSQTGKTASAQQPEPSAPEKTVPAQQPQPPAPEKALYKEIKQKSEEEKTVSALKKPAPPAEPVKSQQVDSGVTDRQKASKKQPYSVHAYSFKAEQDAQNEIKRLRGLGFDAYLATIELEEKGTWHRVKVGHYATRAEAVQAAQEIRQKNPRITPQILRNR